MASVPFTAHFFAEGEREDEDDGGIGASGVSEREKRLCHCSAVRDDDKNGGMAFFFLASVNVFLAEIIQCLSLSMAYFAIPKLTFIDRVTLG